MSRHYRISTQSVKGALRFQFHRFTGSHTKTIVVVPLEIASGFLRILRPVVPDLESKIQPEWIRSLNI